MAEHGFQGTPTPQHFRFSKYSDEIRFMRALERTAANKSSVLRNLALAWIEHIEKTGPVEFPVEIRPKHPRKDG